MMKSSNDKYSADYKGFSLVSGGLIYSLTSIFRSKSNDTKGLVRTAIALVLITWVPLCVLALVAGTTNDTSSTISFFEDFLFHLRFLLVIPFLILIERIVDHTFIEYIQNSDYLIPNTQQEKFNQLVTRIDKLTDSYIPEIVFLITLYVLVIFNWNSLSVFDSGRNYLTYQGTTTLNPAGWYYLLVCSPILKLLIFRWIWRWIVWAFSIIRISRYKLQTDPLHADRMAGLAYTNLSPMTFSFILMAPSAIIAASIGIDIIYHGAVLKSFIFPIMLYIVLLPIVLYAPLISFFPFLIRAKSYGIRKFGNLIRKHNIDYAAKWIEGAPPKDDHLLGSVDNSSLSDINGSYASVQGLKMIPVDIKMFILSLGLNALPFIPLIFTYYSVSQLFKILTSSLLGG